MDNQEDCFKRAPALPIAEAGAIGDPATHTLFRLEPADWEEFNRLLEGPARELPELRELLATKAPWEK